MVDLRLSRYLVTSPLVTIDQQRRRIVMATRTGEVLDLDDDLWNAVSGGDTDGLDAETLAMLRDAELLVPADEDELRTILDGNEAAIRDSGVLKVVVQPTAACQLGCTYCGQEHTADRLSPHHQERLIARTRARLETGGFHTLTVGWFGAEPLLALDVIEAMTPEFRSMADEHGCSFDSTIVSNGLRLDRETCEALDRCSVSFVEVTVDGMPEWHDQQRMYKSGRGSHARIMQRLADIGTLQPAFEVGIRCNVTAESAPSVPAFIDHLADTGLQDIVRRVYFAPIHNWGNEASSMSLERDEFAALEIQWMAQLLRRGFDIGSLPTRKPVVCMATAKDAELTDAGGNLFNCTEVSYVPAYGEPNVHQIGTLDTGVDVARRRTFGAFNERIRQNEVPCTSCNLLPICGGSCPKAWQEGEVPCPSYKWHLPRRLLLELAKARVADDADPSVPRRPAASDTSANRHAPHTPVTIRARPGNEPTVSLSDVQ